MGDGTNTAPAIDFSKYVTSAPAIDFSKYTAAPQFPITPNEGESFADTMARAAKAGKNVTPEQIAASVAEGKKDVPTVLGAAALAGPAVLAAGVAPEAASTAVGGGLAGATAGGATAGVAQSLLEKALHHIAGEDVLTAQDAKDVAAAGGWGAVIGLGLGLPPAIAGKLMESEAGKHALLTAADWLTDEIPGAATIKKIARIVGKNINVGDIKLPAEAFDTSEAEKAITPNEPPGKPAPKVAPSVRRTPGQVAPEQVGAPAERVPQAAGTESAQLPGGGVLQRTPKALPPAPVEPKSLDQIINEAVGNKPLAPNVPLRAQPAVSRSTPTLPARAFGSTVAPEVSEATGAATVKPGELPEAFKTEVGKTTGAGGPKYGQTLKQSIENPNAPAAESPKERLQRIYPDKGVRQQVHIVGEDFYEAAKGDPDVVKAATKLSGPDVAKAATNLGEDLGQLRVGSQKAAYAGESQVRPQELLSRLIKKGHTPQEIIDAAAKPANLSRMANP